MQVWSKKIIIFLDAEDALDLDNFDLEGRRLVVERAAGRRKTPDEMRHKEGGGRCVNFPLRLNIIYDMFLAVVLAALAEEEVKDVHADALAHTVVKGLFFHFFSREIIYFQASRAQKKFFGRAPPFTT